MTSPDAKPSSSAPSSSWLKKIGWTALALTMIVLVVVLVVWTVAPSRSEFVVLSRTDAAKAGETFVINASGLASRRARLADYIRRKFDASYDGSTSLTRTLGAGRAEDIVSADFKLPIVLGPSELTFGINLTLLIQRIYDKIFAEPGSFLIIEDFNADAPRSVTLSAAKRSGIHIKELVDNRARFLGDATDFIVSEVFEAGLNCADQPCGRDLPSREVELQRLAQIIDTATAGRSTRLCRGINDIDDCVTRAIEELDMVNQEAEVSSFVRLLLNLRSLQHRIDTGADTTALRLGVEAIDVGLRRLRFDGFFSRALRSERAFKHILASVRLQALDISSPFLKTLHHYIDGRADFRAGEFDKALEHYESVVDAPSWFAELLDWRLMTVNAALAKGDVEKTQELIQQIEDGALGSTYLSHGYAGKMIANMVEQNPESFDASIRSELHQRAMNHFGNAFRLATKQYDRLGIVAEQARAAFVLGSASEANRELQNVDKRFREVYGSLGANQEDAKRSLAMASYSLASLYFHLDRQDLGKYWLTEAITSAPEFLDGVRKQAEFDKWRSDDPEDYDRWMNKAEAVGMSNAQREE